MICSNLGKIYLKLNLLMSYFNQDIEITVLFHDNQRNFFFQFNIPGYLLNWNMI